MTNEEKDFVIVCQALTKLAILKDKKIEESQVALMGKFMLANLKAKDILEACGLFAKRLNKFPDVSDFFDLISPMESTEVLIEKEISDLWEIIRCGRDNFKTSGKVLTDHQRELLEAWSWHSLERMSVGDVTKTRQNMLFFLKGKIKADSRIKIELDKKSISEYKSEKTQGGQLEQSTYDY